VTLANGVARETRFAAARAASLDALAVAAQRVALALVLDAGGNGG
jgi:hypothetical protein